MIELIHASQNQLLASLPDEELRCLQPLLELVDLPLGKVLHESGAPRQFVYFPINVIVSLLYVLESGASTEIAVVGHEGVVGICVFLGGSFMPNRAVVQSAGMSYRIRANVIQAAFERSSQVKHQMLRYTQALLTQMSQTAVCNRHHSVDQQLCRWLLLSLDRLDGDELVMTHELIANMLGVRREGVTEAALKLQSNGLIRYSRGHISVLDRPGLELRVCECYGVVRDEYARVLADPVAS